MAWVSHKILNFACGRRSPTHSCEGVNYTTGNEYNQVYGRIIGYQIEQPETLYFASIGNSINTYYVDGISVTRGSARQHIWTFACGINEGTRYSGSTCPCVTGSRQTGGYSFIGQNYLCESDLTAWNGTNGVFFPDGDPLWDGQGCGPTSSCCTFNSSPCTVQCNTAFPPQLITLRSGSVVVMEEFKLRILQYNSWSSM